MILYRHASVIVGCLVLVTCTTAQAEDDSQLVELVVGLLVDSDHDIRALAFEQIRNEAQGAAATRKFAAQLHIVEPDTQVGLLRALADRGDSAAKPAVLQLLASSELPQVRVAAISALGSLGNAKDCEQLVASLAFGSDLEQNAARGSLVRLKGETVGQAIVAEAKQAEPDLCVTLIDVLASRRALDTIPDLLQFSVEDEATERTAAMAALGEIGGPEHIGGMVQGVLRAAPGSERAAAEKAVMFVCGRIEDQETRAFPLLAAMNDLKQTDRDAVLPTLGRVGGQAALKVVEAAIENRDADRHRAGLQAIANWPDASVAPQLMRLAKTDKHDSHRTTALRALIRVAPLPDGRTDVQKLDLLIRAMSMCQRDAERQLVLQRARAVRIPETLRFVLPYLEQKKHAQQACQTIVELAHHRHLREPHEQEFHKALDQVIEISDDDVVIDRARRYKNDQTWVRPKS